MATKISSIYTLITADDKPLKRGLVRARGEAVKGAKKIQGALSKINFKAVALGAAAFGASMAFATKKFIDLAVEQERVEKRLGAVLKSTGEAAGFNLDQLKDMAAAMQSVTTIGDEVILSGQAMLATFKQIRGEAFERATMAALDLSEVMQQDLRSSVVMVGKALNDPIANLGALGRAGIQFTKQQKEVIKSLWETGRVAEAQNIILKEMESQFGGAARAAKDTFGGAVKSLGNTLGDIGERIGFAVMPPIKDLIDRFNFWISTNDKLLKQDIPKFITSIGEAAMKSVQFVINLDNALDRILGGKTDKPILQLHLEQLKQTEVRYDRQLKTLEKIGSTGSNAYKKVEQRLSLVRDKIKLVTAQLKDSLSTIQNDFGSINKQIAGVSSDKGIGGVSTKKGGGEKPPPLFATDAFEFNRFKQAEVLKRDVAKETYDAMGAFEMMRFKQSEVLQRDSIKKHESYFDSLSKLSERTAWAMQDNFSNIFFDAMQGELKSFQDYMTAVLDSIQRAIADVAAQMVTRGLFGDIGTAGGGGLIGKLFKPDIKAQHGAYLGERIRGYGESGKSYEFHPNEIVAPIGKGGGGGVKMDVNVVNNLGVEADVNQTQTFVNPEKIVTDIVLNRKLTSRGFRQGLRS